MIPQYIITLFNWIKTELDKIHKEVSQTPRDLESLAKLLDSRLVKIERRIKDIQDRSEVQNDR